MVFKTRAPWTVIRCAVGAWATLFSTLASAGTSEINVKSTQHGQDIYVVAYESERGDSPLEPGIYALRRGKEKPILLLRGQIKGAGRAFNGVLSQFEITAATDRAEALSIVDQRLILFSNRTRPGKSDSMVVFGSKAAPLLDVMTRRQMPLGPIESIDDISVLNHRYTYSNNYQTVLVSVKQKNAFGPGITFAFLIWKGDTRAPNKLELVNAPVIIDYEFYTPKELGRYLNPLAEDQVLSPTHLHAFAQEQVSDDRILANWRVEIGKLYRALKTERSADAAKATREKNKGLPYYSLFDGQLVFQELPNEVVAERPLVIVQRMSPLGSGSGVLAGLAKGRRELEQNAPPAIYGRIDYDANRKAYKVFPVASDDNMSSIVVVDGHPTLFLKTNKNAVGHVNVGSVLEGDLKAVAATHVDVSARQNLGEFQHYFVVSRSTRDMGDRTDVLVVEERDGVLRFDRSLNINKRFMSEKELVNRVHLRETSSGNMQRVVLIDLVTSTERILSGRVVKDNITTPLLNLSDSRGSKAVQTYLKSLDDETLVQDQVLYRKYNPTGATAIQSGFYISEWSTFSMDHDTRGARTTNDGMHFVPGELLRLGGKRGAISTLDSKELIDIKLPDKSKVPKFRVSAFALNPDAGKKLASGTFSVLIHVGSSIKDVDLRSGYRTVDVPGDFSRLTGAKIIQGRRARGLNATLLLFFKDAGESPEQKSKRGQTERTLEKREKGGIYAVNFDISQSSSADVKSRMSHLVEQWIEREEVTPTVIKHRLVYDGAGDPYWILTPEKERHDRFYSVRKFSLAENTQLYPNRAGERIMLRHNEPPEDDDYGSLFHTTSRWLVYMEQDLEDQFTWYKEWMKERQKAADAAGTPAKPKRQASMFPQLDQFLEDRANEKGPKLHEVVLVEPQMKEFILKHMVGRLISGEKTHWSLKQPNFNLYILDVTANAKETRDELDKIAKAGSGRHLLFADLALIMHADGVQASEGMVGPSAPVEEEVDDPENATDEDNKDETDKRPRAFPFGSRENPAAVAEPVEEVQEVEDDGDDTGFTGSRLMVLATEGDRVPMREFKSRSQSTPHVPMLLLATPAEWRAMAAHYDTEAAAGVFNSFKINAQFLTSTWSVWAPPTGKASKEIQAVTKIPVSRDEYNVFPNLEKMLTEAASKTGGTEHRLVIIPDELKPLVRRLVLSRWATDSKSLQGPWNHSNFDLALFQIQPDKELTQEAIRDNFDAMRGATTSRRPVLLGDMAEILKIGRPHSGSQNGGFLLRDPAGAKNPTSGLGADDSGAPSMSTRQFPHLMWWLSTEGREIQPKKTRGWRVTDEVKPEIPMLIFASERELAQLQTDAAFEERFGDFKSQFKIDRLEVPSTETKIRLVEELFARPEIAGLNYGFEHNGLPNLEARRQLIGVMVGRVEQVARMQKQEPTSAFLRTYTELRRTLTEDTRLRQERRIDRFFFERLYRRVFPMPLNFEILTKDDPLRRLEDPDKAAIGLQEKGYEGSNDLKAQVIETVVSQTRGSDEGRPIPSTTILYGGTSTGKTFLFKTLVAYLGLKLYDFDKPSDDTASAFIVNAGTLVEEDDPNNTTRMSVDKAIAHAENFLSLPNGSRGFVLFDDLHKGTGKVRQKLLAFIQTFLENPMMRVRRMNANKDIVEIPVRNLNLYITLNPQQDLDVLGRYVDQDSEDSLDKRIIAALAGDNVQIDESFIARWSTKIDLDRFPREAKLPSLVSRIRNATQQEFSGRPRLMLVTPPVLSRLVEGFPNANAREFLSTATYGILGLDNDMQTAPIYIVHANGPNAGSSYSPRNRPVDSNAVREVLKATTVVRPIRGSDISSQVDFLAFLLDGFRAHVYHALITAAQRMPEMSGSKELRKTDLAAFLLGSLHNFVEYPEVPLSQVRVRPDELGGVKERHIVEFNEAINRHSVSQDSFFKFRFHSETSRNSVSLDQFLGNGMTAPPKRGRIDVMAETAGAIQLLLKDLMGAYFRISNVDGHLELQDWASRLTETEPRAAFRELSEKIVRIFGQFSRDLTDSELREMASEVHGRQEILDYDRVRLFLMCVDKAMTQLPWGRVSRFMFDAVDHGVKDLSFGLRPELQHLMFNSLYSPLTTMTPEAVEQIALSSKDLRDFEKEKGDRLHTRFQRECENLLIPMAKGK